MHAFLFKEVQTDRLVALCCNMHHIEAILIDQLEISSIINQNLAHINVSSEGSIVNSCKLVLRSLHINPIGNLLLFKLSYGSLDQHIKTFLFVLEDSHMQQCEALPVHKVINPCLVRDLNVTLAHIQVPSEIIRATGICLQILTKLMVRVLLDQLHTVVRHLLDLLGLLISLAGIHIVLIGLGSISQYVLIVVRNKFSVVILHR